MPDTIHVKKSITPAERLALLGLAELCDRHHRKGEELEEAVAELIGEERGKYGYGLASAFMYAYDTHDADELIRDLEIDVRLPKREVAV